VAAESRNDGIRCNAILPSVIDTPGNRASMPKADHDKWVKPAQIDVAPLGSDRPIDAKNPKDPRLNRRVELIRVTQ